MSGALVTALVASLAAAAAVYALRPAPGAPATTRYYAIAAFVLLLLGLVAILSEWLRRRQGRRARPPTDFLIDVSNRRDAYRIPYPEGERPSLQLVGSAVGRALEVLDVSEGGIRFRAPEGLRCEGTVTGQLVLPGGEIHGIAGEVVRCEPGEAALRLTRSLPPHVLLDEQRRLRGYLKPKSA